MVLAREIRTYSFKPPLEGAAAVPGLNQVLCRMLATDRAESYCDAGEAAEAMEWVAREPDADMCRAVLEQRVVPAMRALFLRHWEAKEGVPWEDTFECGQRYMEQELTRNRKAANWLIRERLAAGNSRAWDATALCTILLWSQVHPLKAAEEPEDHADVSRFREWRNELAHCVAWDAEKATVCASVLWAFIERHPPASR
jgi:hypothetical protein